MLYPSGDSIEGRTGERIIINKIEITIGLFDPFLASVCVEIITLLQPSGDSIEGRIEKRIIINMIEITFGLLDPSSRF